MNPGLARIIGVMLKLDFQRAVPQHPEDHAGIRRVWRDLMFVCDDARVCHRGETDPTGDERVRPVARQAGLIPHRGHAEHKLAPLGSTGDESWRTLRGASRNKVFLATSDEFTARNASGPVRAQGPKLTVPSESGPGPRVAGDRPRRRSAASRFHRQQELRADVMTSFPARVFTQLQNGPGGRAAA